MQQSAERIQQLWQTLATIDAFFYSAEPGPASRTGWAGEGQGRVQTEQHGEDELHFIETGEFRQQQGLPVAMHNRFIWQRRTQGIALSHGRRGEPVFLFELRWLDGGWRSVADHVCINDLYSGELIEKGNGFALNWRILGPKKDEHLHYRYRTDNS